MSHALHGSDEFLFGNVRVRRIEPNPADGTLMVKVVYAEREEQEIQYDDVLYSQMGRNAEGARIVLAVELTPEEYRGVKHQNSATLFQEDCHLQNLDSLEEMKRRGYRLFIHYAGKRDEYIVIAKSVFIR